MSVRKQIEHKDMLRNLDQPFSALTLNEMNEKDGWVMLGVVRCVLSRDEVLVYYFAREIP